MADTVMLTNRIVCRSVLPLFKVVYDADSSFLKDLLANVNGTFQFGVKGTEDGAWVEFKDGECKVNIGVNPAADVAIMFKSHAAMNAMFTGGKPAEIGLPSLKGIWRLPLVIKTVPLLLGLTLLMPDNNPSDQAKRELKVRMTLYMVTNALSQLNKGGDEGMQKWTAKQPDRIYQLSVQDGDAAYLRIKAGKTKAGRGIYTRKGPFVHMKFTSLDSAYAVLCEGKDTLRAVADNDIIMEGSPEYTGTLGSFMVKIQELLLG